MNRLLLCLVVLCALVLALGLTSACAAGDSGPMAGALAASPGGARPFTMVFMNDPQVGGWGTHEDCLKLEWRTLLDADEQDACEHKDGQCSTLVEGKYRAQAIANTTLLGAWPASSYLTRGGGPVQQPVAVVINGDFTNFGHKPQYDVYKRYHVSGLGSLPMLPGLGNHDYANNVDECYVNNCARRSVLYLLGSLWGGKVETPTAGVTGNFPVHWVQDLDWTVGSTYKDGRGSLAYSWEYGDYHFVQLHFHPFYATTIGYDPWPLGAGGGSHSEFNVEPSMTWLANDLARATASGKKIVINLHDPGEYWSNTDPAWLALFPTNNVVAMFQGHSLSGNLGHVGEVNNSSTLNNFGDSIPIFGAGHAGYSSCETSDKFLLVEFGDSYFNVATIDTYTYTGSLPGTPTFYEPLNSQYLSTYAISVPSLAALPSYAFVAIGVPYEDVAYQHDTWIIGSVSEPRIGDYNDGGAVDTLYRAAGGGYFYQNWVQAMPGLYAAEAGDRHGYALATGDFDGNGYPDLAAGSPGEGLLDYADNHEGIVSVAYGTSTGLHGEIVIFDQHATGVAETPEAQDQFGSALAVGDFDGNGYDDLAVGVPYEDIAGAGNDAGVVHVFYGGMGGLSSSQFVDEGSVPGGDAEGDDRFGAALAAGDFDGDGYDDLAVGALGEDIEVSGADRNDGGRIHLLYGTASGLAASGSHSIDEDDLAGGDAEGDDRFGAALAAGDFNGDGYDDLAVGVPGEDIPGAGNDAGFVFALYGTSAGIGGAVQYFQESSLAGGTSEGGDRFGAVLAAGDLNDNGYDDLAVGVPGEDIPNRGNDAGAAYVVYGVSGGFGSGHLLSQVNMPVSDGPQGGDGFGSALAIGECNHAPVVNAGANAEIDENTPFTRTGSFLDEDDGDTWTATVDYGDGSGVQSLTLAGLGFTLEHTYADDGVYTVEVVVTDWHGWAGTDSVEVTVLNVP
jgi:hypothetical protein